MTEPGARDLSKEHVRRKVWDLMEKQAIVRPPRPVRGRIPNFEGAERAAGRLLELQEFKAAKTVKVNPDSPQRPVREAVLNAKKTLLTPTPRLRVGFLVLDPESSCEKAHCLLRPSKAHSGMPGRSTCATSRNWIY